jgi:hypothetical protein
VTDGGESVNDEIRLIGEYSGIRLKTTHAGVSQISHTREECASDRLMPYICLPEEGLFLRTAVNSYLAIRTTIETRQDL